MSDEVEYFAIKADMENPADEWWQWLDEQAPGLAASLRKNEGAVVSEDVLRWLSSGPGYDDGPEHARAALLVYGALEEPFKDLVAGPHAVYEGPE